MKKQLKKLVSWLLSGSLILGTVCIRGGTGNAAESDPAKDFMENFLIHSVISCDERLQNTYGEGVIW